MITRSIFTLVNVIVDERIVEQYDLLGEREHVLVLFVSVFHTHNTGHETVQRDLLYFAFSQQIDYVAAETFPGVAYNWDQLGKYQRQ